MSRSDPGDGGWVPPVDDSFVRHFNHGCNPVPIFTKEQLMTQHQMAVGDPMQSYGPPQPTHDLAAAKASLPGVAEALDRLEYSRSELTQRVHQLIEHIQPVVQPAEPLTEGMLKPSGDQRPISPIARLIHEHADAFDALARTLADTNARVDV